MSERRRSLTADQYRTVGICPTAGKLSGLHSGARWPPWLLMGQVRRTQGGESGFERSVDGLTGGADTVSGGRRGRLLLCGLFFDRLLERVPRLFEFLDTFGLENLEVGS